MAREKEAPEARGWPGAVWGVCGKGREREGRAEGAKGEGNTPFSIKLIWIGFEIWGGAEPPLGRRPPPPPPYPPLIFGSDAELGQKRFFRVFEFLPPV